MDPNKTPTALITGGTGGIGHHSAIGIAKTGAEVWVSGRNPGRGEAAVDAIRKASQNADVHFLQADLASIQGTERLATTFLSQRDTLDVLVNNAGYLGSEPRTSEDGLEMHFAVNVLAPWCLTHALLPALKAAPAARVVNVSGGDKPAAVDPDNLQAEKGFKGLMTYTHSKSVLESMSLMLAGQLEPEGITVNVVFPGRASTTMTRSLSMSALPGPMKLMYPFFKLFFTEDGGKSAAKAARSTIWGATSSELDGVTGRYFDTDMNEQRLHATSYESQVQSRIVELLQSSVDGG